MAGYRFSLILLRGLGQIMLQENAATGLLFLIGIFYGSSLMGIASTLAVCCGTMTAQLLRYDKTEIEKGLYGFSAALIGPALILFFEPVFVVWLAIITGSIAATILQHLFIVKKIPVFTLPFVLVTWGIIFLFQNWYLVAPSELLSAAIPVDQDFTFALRGFGEVIFQGSLFASLAFFIGVYIHSPISALYGLAGALLAGVLSFWFSAPVGEIGMGLFSYNAVLCAIVFAGDQVKDGVWVLISVALSVAIGLTMYHYKLIQLTFPFVAASCITLVLRSLFTDSYSRQKR
ncbi:Urea transporter [compost metagenome]